MSNYTTSGAKIEVLLKEIFTLPRQDRITLLQKFFFSSIKHDNAITIPMLHEAGVPVVDIANALNIDPSLIYRDYLKKEEKKVGKSA